LLEIGDADRVSIGMKVMHLSRTRQNGQVL